MEQARARFIDPSTVGTSTASTATLYPFQRKSFYANGRFWVFWSDGTNMVYSTSTDGLTWSAATAIRSAILGYYFSVWFDGTYLHYAYANSSAIYYRRGTPNADGTITWSAVEQTVSTTYSITNYPMISVDSNGYVWIGYRDSYLGNSYPYVIKSGNNDGTWGTTPSGFPYQLSTTSDGYWKVSVIPLTAGKMLAIYARDSYAICAKKWDGSAWGTEVITTSAIYAGGYHSAVAQGDDVHLTFLKASTYDILYVKYTYSTSSFGTETTLVAGATSSSPPVLGIDTTTNDLYAFAATKTTGTPSGWTANHIYYIKYTASSGTWGSWTDWIDESTEVLTGAGRLTSFYQAYGNKIGLEYMTKTAADYNVKFAFLSIAVAYTKTLTENLGLADSVFKAPSTVKSELLGLSDTVSAVRVLFQTLTELLGLSDAVAKSPSVVRSESLGLLDSYSRLWSAYRVYSESLGLSDTVQKVPSVVKAEALGLSDAVQKSPSMLKSEILGLSDSYSRTWSSYRTFSELLGLVDSLRKEPGKVLPEALGLSDAFSRTWAVQRTCTEALGLKDYVSKQVSLHALMEVLGLLDSIKYAKNPTILAKLIQKYIQLEEVEER